MRVKTRSLLPKRGHLLHLKEATRNTAAYGLKLNLTIPEYIQCSMLGEKWL